jgi:acyl-coenzyme A synthetase/AMP-(fatty) acid ligase
MLPVTSAFEQFGERIALDLGSSKKTFSDVTAAARRIAAHLEEMPDTKFVVCEASNVELYISVFCACVLTDRTVVPFSTLKFPFADLNELLPHFVFIDEKGELSTHDGQGSAERKQGDVYCLFTSGTTGKPKGILVSQWNLRAYLDGISEFIPEYSKAANISAVFSPLFDLFYHDLLLAFSFGLSLQIPTPRERMTMSDYAVNRPIDIWFSTPTLAANILAALERAPASNTSKPSIPISLFCGERLGAGLALDWASKTGGAIINVYGPTETTIACTGERLAMDVLEPNTDVSIGKAFGGNLTEISDRGTLVVRGPQVARYLNVIQPDFFDTKDLVADHEGKLYFLGRADGQLKIKGMRIEKEELERVACAVPGVKYAKIQPIQSAGLITGFNVVIVGDAAARLVNDAFKQRYGAALVPSGIQYVEEFETGTSGKARV